MKDLTKELGLLQAAATEIKRLREVNYTMQLRLDMFDTIVNLVGAKTSSKGTGMTVDICWEIEDLIRQIQGSEDKVNYKSLEPMQK